MWCKLARAHAVEWPLLQYRYLLSPFATSQQLIKRWRKPVSILCFIYSDFDSCNASLLNNKESNHFRAECVSWNSTNLLSRSTQRYPTLRDRTYLTRKTYTIVGLSRDGIYFAVFARTVKLSQAVQSLICGRIKWGPLDWCSQSQPERRGRLQRAFQYNGTYLLIL